MGLATAWTVGRLGYMALRRMLFTRARPAGPYYVVDIDVDALEFALGRRCFRPNWMFSYNFRGENLNLARAFRDDHARYSNVRWWQTHVRGWVHADGQLYIRAHHEPEPTEHPDPHEKGFGYETDRAMRTLETALDDAGIRIESYVREIDRTELDRDDLNAPDHD